jgi:hypothetical protein
LSGAAGYRRKKIMKTLLATIVGLGLLTGTANAQYVRIIPSYGISPEICAPGFAHQFQHAMPKVAEAPAAQAEQPADEAAPEAPAEAAPATPAQPAPQAPLPPK